jgi:hypothetical protein
VSYKDRKKVAADLKLVYGSVTEDEALGALSDFLRWPNLSRLKNQNLEMALSF